MPLATCINFGLAARSVVALSGHFAKLLAMPPLHPSLNPSSQPTIVDRIFEPRSLYLISALFILYATTMPWDMEATPDWSGVQWNPVWDAARGRMNSIPDMVQNVLLFLPLGFFGWFARRRVGEVMVTALAVSVTAELLQTMSPSRTSSANDLMTNTAGAFLGVMGALYVASRYDGRWRRWVSRQPGSAVCVAIFAAIFFRSLAPFFPTLDVSSFKGQVRVFFESPWGRKNVLQMLFDVVLYAGFALTLARELPAIRSRHIPHTVGIAYALILACVLEFAQFFFHGHHPAIQDVTAAWMGAAIGAAVAHKVGVSHARERGELSRNFPGWVLAFALLLPVLRALDPFRIEPGDLSISVWNFVPFASMFARVNQFTVANFFTVVAVYMPLAHLLWARRHPTRKIVIACAGLAILLEVLQVPIEGRTFDITEALIASCAALIVPAFWNQASMR